MIFEIAANLDERETTKIHFNYFLDLAIKIMKIYLIGHIIQHSFNLLSYELFHSRC
jgi:hypothetical protein